MKPKPLKLYSILYEHVHGKEGLIKKIICNNLKLNEGMKKWN